MFEHLDDLAPPEPRLGPVLARAARLRRRHRARVALATTLSVLVVAALVGAAVAAVAGRRAPPARLSARQLTYEYRRHPDPLPAGTPVPVTALADVVFVGPGDGFALAVHRQTVLLATTADGGAAWQVVDPALPVASPTTVGGARGQGQLEFTDVLHGYLWDGTTTPAPTAPLWVTDDGGRQWQRAPIGPVVYDVSAIGADVWAVVGTCPWTRTGGASTATGGVSADGGTPACSLVLEVSVDFGAHWQQVPGTIPATPAVDGVPGTGVELARITVTRAYVLSAFRPGGGPPVLAFTADGGTAWTTRPMPCASPVDLGAELAASSTDDLWLFCGGQGSAGTQSQDKALYRSADGGTQWVLTAAASGLGGTAVPTTPGVGTLPLGGFLSPMTIGHQNLAVASPTTAWLYPGRGTVLVTGDGGRTWQPVSGLSGSAPTGGTRGNLTFISATDGWVCELGVGLWRTTDGTAWQRLGT